MRRSILFLPLLVGIVATFWLGTASGTLTGAAMQSVLAVFP